MGKLKYLIRRIAGMNYRQFFQKIDEVHKKAASASCLSFSTWSGAALYIRQATWIMPCSRCMTSTVPSARR